MEVELCIATSLFSRLLAHVLLEARQQKVGDAVRASRAALLTKRALEVSYDPVERLR